MGVGGLEIRLLGGFAVRLDNQPVTAFRSSKSRALLAYLASQPDQDHPRTLLATLFWGDLPDTAAKTNLRIELSNLKKLLSAHPALAISNTTVRFHSAFASTDAHSFSQAVTRFFALASEAQAENLRELALAAESYQGEFLAGFYLDDSIEFDDWRVSKQEQLHEQMMLALATLQIRYVEQGRWSELAGAARRQLALVPWTESAHRSLMHALAAQGQSQAALEQFEKCCKILREELGVEPSLTTLEFAERLQKGRPAIASAQHNLTSQLKSLVGRAEEIARLHILLQKEHLVTLLGIGGVGKSHLAQAVAQKALDYFADGVWFVPVAHIEPSETASERVALAIAAATGYAITNTQAPLAEVISYLANQQLLLVLDNWEHLLAVAESVLDALLNKTPVHILATSRVPLMIEGEVLVRLEGLPPDEAFILFVERARRLVPTFATSENVEITRGVNRICQQVAGLPLGIELAASWVEHYSVADIGQSLAQITIAPQQADALLPRHQRLSNVFEYSWRLLSLREQQVLAQLSVFRGGFARAAAVTIAESGLSELSALIGHSLVQRISAGRYDLHPLIQEFAAGKLSEEQRATLYHKYSHHYLGELISTERAQRAARLQIDFANLRNAWQRAVEAGDAEIVQEAVRHFCEFMSQLALMSDGYMLFGQAIARFDNDFGSEPGHNELVAQLLEQQWIFARTIYGMSSTLGLLHRILSLTTNQEVLAQTHVNLANIYAESGEWERTDTHFDQAEALSRDASDTGAYVRMVEARTHINAIHFRGDYAKGIARMEEMLNLLDTATSPIPDKENLRYRVLSAIQILALRHGDYALAIRYARQNLATISDLVHRPQSIRALLGLALAEQFAGVYAEAVAHNQEALSVAQEIGMNDEVALLHANLCLTLRQCGELEEALAHGLQGVELLKSLHIARQEGQARNRVGHTLLALGRSADAYAAYGEALALWERLQHPNRYEAVAGRAAAAFRLSQQDEALALVEEALEFVANNGLLKIVEPALLLLNCEAVLTGCGQAERARQVLQQAESWMLTIAERISDDEVRHSFLYNRPDNQYLRARMAALA